VDKPEFAAEWEFGGDLQELRGISMSHIGHGFDFPFYPEMFVITQVQQYLLASLFLANRVDHQPAATLEVDQGFCDGRPGECRINNRVQLVRGTYCHSNRIHMHLRDSTAGVRIRTLAIVLSQSSPRTV